MEETLFVFFVYLTLRFSFLRRDAMSSKTSEVETKVEKKAAHGGKSQYYKSEEYKGIQKQRKEWRDLLKKLGNPEVDAKIKSICNQHKEEYVEGQIPEMFKGIVTREKGWIKMKAGYRPCLWGNDSTDWALHTSILLLLYAFYTGFFTLTYYLYVWSGDTILWIYMAMMIIAISVLMFVVAKGYIDLDEEMDEEMEKAKA